MLATYPAEKRELARAVYHRFADGDSTQFFSQLFLVLDVYAHYAERIPARMISANADSLATVQEMREEIGLLAKTIETRDVNITNHAEKTDELCRITLAKCNETIAGIELTVKNLGARVDTKAIVQGIENSRSNPAFADKIICAVHPAHGANLASRGLAHAGKNSRQQPPKPSPNGHKRIWKTAWTTSLIWSIGRGNPLHLPVLLGNRRLLRT